MAGTAGQRTPAPSRASELVARVASGLVLAALALLGLLVGGWVVATLLAVVMAIVHLEWANITDHSPWPAAVFTAGLVIAAAAIPLGMTEGGLIIVGMAIVASALTMSAWRPIGVAYAAVLGIGLLLLRLSPDGEGFRAVLIILVVVAVTDTAAYFAGRAIGGAKLLPSVSPNKTWAGAIGGFVAGTVSGLLVAAYLGVAIVAPFVAIAAGLSIAAQAGDLFESWIKRMFGARTPAASSPATAD